MSGIYPEGFAKMLIEHAGKRYQPSNGTEGECFIASWCKQCARADLDERDGYARCDLLARSMAFSPGDEGYPVEWQYGKDGQPCCTAFVPVGEKIPEPRCAHTPDMFDATPNGRLA